MTKPVYREALLRCLLKFRELRRWSVTEKINPWAFRQALLTVLEFDRLFALDTGVLKNYLESFDAQAVLEAKKLFEDLPT